MSVVIHVSVYMHVCSMYMYRNYLCIPCRQEPCRKAICYKEQQTLLWRTGIWSAGNVLYFTMYIQCYNYSAKYL